jgi:predicted nucleic acid-binding protein
MRVLLDTNVLCRLADRGHPFHAAAETAVHALRRRGDEPCLVPQVLYEYWVVVTRPLSDADKALSLWVELFTLLRDERGIYPLWRDLAARHDVKGKAAHDARLVAAMKRHGLERLLTFNATDFRRFEGIEATEAQSTATSR